MSGQCTTIFNIELVIYAFVSINLSWSSKRLCCNLADSSHFQLAFFISLFSKLVGSKFHTYVREANLSHDEICILICDPKIFFYIHCAEAILDSVPSTPASSTSEYCALDFAVDETVGFEI